MADEAPVRPMTMTRPPDGVMVIDKPKSMSSFDVIRSLRRITRERKIGHAGTLDPMATGVLVLMFNRATRLSNFIMNERKRYSAQVTLGAATDTDDAVGKIIAEGPVNHLDVNTVETALRKFVGFNQQRPPNYSALHVKGKRAYELARKGEVLHLDSRTVEISGIEEIKIDIPHVHFGIWCGKGTYIRSIARDLGENLGTFGHLSALRRTDSAGFSIQQALSLSQIEAAGADWKNLLISPFKALECCSTLELEPAEARALSLGQRVKKVEALTAGIYRVPIPRTQRLLAVIDARIDDHYPKTRVFEPAWNDLNTSA